jgi:D-glycero-alpha-D-manno-heptose-7-phosphate kinase
VRICDLGGWTDTWFGGPDRVVNLAVGPGVTVSVEAATGRDPVVLDVDGDAAPTAVVPGATRAGRHRLAEAAIDTSPPPSGCGVTIRVRSAVPAGCGTGTSAAVAVALLGALAASRGERPRAREIAYAAHRLEGDVRGEDSGIPDQPCAATGGINDLEVDRYPGAVVQPLPAWGRWRDG